jgi:hypothetical protein
MGKANSRAFSDTSPPRLFAQYCWGRAVSHAISLEFTRQTKEGQKQSEGVALNYLYDGMQADKVNKRVVH